MKEKLDLDEEERLRKIEKRIDFLEGRIEELESLILRLALKGEVNNEGKRKRDKAQD